MLIFAQFCFGLTALELLRLGWICRWLDAARYGKLHSMKGLLKAAGKHKADLVAYSGAGTSYALMGHTALHWAAAKVCITTTTDLASFPFLPTNPSLFSFPFLPTNPSLPSFPFLPTNPSLPSPPAFPSPEHQHVKTAPPVVATGACICYMPT